MKGSDDPPQPSNRDSASPLVIEELESFVDLFFAFLACDVGREEEYKFIERYASSALLIEVADQLVQGVCFGFGAFFLDGCF